MHATDQNLSSLWAIGAYTNIKFIEISPATSGFRSFPHVAVQQAESGRGGKDR